jgi:hypothetical protein
MHQGTVNPVAHPLQRLSDATRLTRPNLGRGPCEIARALSERAEPPPRIVAILQRSMNLNPKKAAEGGQERP